MLCLSSWMIIWLFITIIICSLDAGFVINRPESFKWSIYKPYTNIYMNIDKGYGLIYDGFVIAQSYCNLFENVLCIAALLAHFTKKHTLSVFITYSVTLMTFWKTVIYLLVDVCGGPNGITIFYPLFTLIK